MSSPADIDAEKERLLLAIKVAKQQLEQAENELRNSKTSYEADVIPSFGTALKGVVLGMATYMAVVSTATALYTSLTQTGTSGGKKAAPKKKPAPKKKAVSPKH